jgi:hypothetical protein
VYALIVKKGLPAAKIGGQWRFEESKVREWFEAQYTAADGDPVKPSPVQRH